MKRARINVFDGEESDEWVEAEEEWVRIHRRPRRDLFSPHDSQGGPKLSDISKRREFAALTEENGGSLTDGETERLCLRSGQEAKNSERVWRE